MEKNIKEYVKELNNKLVGNFYLADGLNQVSKRHKPIWEFGLTDIQNLGENLYKAKTLLTGEGETVYIKTEEYTDRPLKVVVVLGVSENKEDITAGFGMGADGANTVYMFKDKKIKAEKSKENKTANEIKDMAERINLSDEVAKSLANVYDVLDEPRKYAIRQYLQNLNFNISNQVAILLGQMIEAVPLKTHQDIKDVGFYSNAAKGRSSDDLFALKAACGLKQAGKDPSELFDNGQFKSREEIEKVVARVISESKNKDKDPNEKGKKQLIDALIKMGWDEDVSTEAVDKTYDADLGDAENMKNALSYKQQARLLNKEQKHKIGAAGYYGYSMSNNAVNAYQNGEMPLSKWSKAEILSALPKFGYPKNIIEQLRKLSKKTLQESLLYNSSWHHTSNRYNKTDFYTIEDYDEDTFTMPTEEKQTTKPKREPYVEYVVNPLKGQWGGSRRHPKFLGYDDVVGEDYNGKNIVLFKGVTDQYGNRITGNYYKYDSEGEMTKEEYIKLFGKEPPSNMVQANLYVPKNEFGVKAGYYSEKSMQKLLQEYSNNCKAIYFISDILG